jgi:hypothetical protein
MHPSVIRIVCPDNNPDRMAKKDDKKKEAEELNVLFKPVEQKIANGQDVCPDNNPDAGMPVD